MSPVRLCLCADDLGLHPAIDRAVRQLAERGRLHAAGCLVGAPHAPGLRPTLDALHRAGLDVGLHLDLTEYPIDRRWRRSLPGLVAAALLHRLPHAALAAEIEAQLDRFEQLAGRRPAFVDGHRHVHQLPQVRDALLAALARRGAKPWLRRTRPPDGLRPPRGASAAERIKPRWIAALGAAGLERGAARAGLRQNARLLGVHGFRADPTGYRDWIDAWLAVARDGDVLMCHPADGSVDGDAIAAARAVEFSVLDSAWMGDALQRHRVVPAPLTFTACG